MNTERHAGLIQDVDLTRKNHIIGCGSLGTAVATILTRMGFTNFTLWDFDIVEDHNIANQLFEAEDIGKKKTSALKTKMLAINKGAHIEERTQKFEIAEGALGRNDIIILCVDSMLARKEIVFLIKGVPYHIIDGRMGGEHGSMFLIPPHRREEYIKDTFYTDEEARPLPCTMKSVIYTVLVVSSTLAKMVVLAHKDPQRYIHATTNMESLFSGIVLEKQ